MSLLQFLVCSCLVLTAIAEIPDRFVALPPELGNKAPARLVFSVADLSQCWNDATARRCVLRAPIRFDEPTWRTSFASTGGVAVQAQPLPTLTLTSEPCSATGVCLGGDSGVSNNPTVHTQQQILDLNEIPGLIMVGSGSTLLLNNLFLNNVAYKSSYVRTDYQPYRTEGAGTGLWPSIQFAPNSTLLVFNSSVTYTNPSSLTCEEYTQRGLFNFQQVYGDQKIMPVNATTNKVVGPVNITVKVRDGRTDEELGKSTSTYVNVTFTCMERPLVTTGPTKNTLAVAIAVPIAVAALAAGLILSWCLKRRRMNCHNAGPKDPSKPGPLYVKDIEMGGGSGPGVAPARLSSASAASGLHVDHGRAAQVETVGSMPYSYGGSSLLWSSPSGLTAGTASFGPDEADTVVGGPSGVLSSQQTAQPAVHHAAAVGVGPAGGQAIRAAGPLGWQRARRLSGRYLQPVDLQVPRTSAASSQDDSAHVHYLARGPDSITPVPSIATGSRQQSASTAEPGTPKNSLEMQLLAANGPASVGTGPGSSSSGDDRRSAVYALLKARSDVAVLRDLRIGPLLGRGSYGRVYRGRWKATTVAVKIIEHYGVDAEASSGSRRVSAGREMLFATSISHPNVVTTFHISTMTINQRSALAKSWLADSKTPEEPDQEAAEAGADAASDADSDDSSASDSDSSESGSPPDLLETWIIMEFCERGSLERALKLGKFKAKDGQPEMIGIYKALLDTASGLDYLHSIGVVHGDLKTANVLLKGSTRDARGVTCKITDFGLSKVLDNENQTHISTGTYGTIVYMPKELLLSGHMTQATDIYSFGLLMWELLTSQPIMDEGLSIGQMFYMIAYQDWRPQLPEGCSPGYADLMVSCWQEDPEQRPTAQQLLKRLQRLYVKAKQQLPAADRDSRPSSSRRVRAAAPAPGRPSLDSTASQNDSSVASSSPLRVSLEMETAAPAAVRLTDQQQQSLQQQQHTGMQPQVPAGTSPPLGSPFTRGAGWEGAAGYDAGHSPAGGSSHESRPTASSTTSKGRNSTESQGGVEEQVVYEPFVHAVLHRATSLSVPAMTSPTARQNTPPAQAAAAAGAAAAAAFAQHTDAAAQVVNVPEPKPISVGGPGGYTALVPQHQHYQLQQEPLLLQPLQQHNGLVQLLPGGAFLDPASFPAQLLAPAEDLIAFEAHSPSSAELYSDSQLQHLTNSSNAMHSGASHEAFGDLHYGGSGRAYIEGFADPTPALLPPQQQWQQQQQPAAMQQLVYSMPQADPLQPPAAAAASLPPPQQQAGGAYNFKDFLPLPPGAPDFSVTEKYIATIEWAARPKVQAAAAAAAAQNLAQMRAQAGVNGTLHLLPSFIREPWQLAPAPLFQYSAGQGFAGCLPDFPDTDDPEGQDRIQLYIRALDMARTPSETIAVTDAIIADAVAVDDAVRAGELDLKEPTGQQGAGGDGMEADAEADAAVLLDALPHAAPADVAFAQPVCVSLQPAAQAIGAAGAAGASTATGEAMRGDSSSALVHAQAAQPANHPGGGGGSSSSANALLSGGGYSTSTAGQRSYGSSSGAGPTYSSNLFSSAAHNSPVDEQQQQQQHQPASTHQPDGSTAHAAARSTVQQGEVQAASLHGPLRSFAGGQTQPAPAVPAALNAPAATGDPSPEHNRWAVLPDHPDSNSAAIPMASGAAAGALTSATGSTSGSFAAWAKSEPPEELVGALSVVDERGL